MEKVSIIIPTYNVEKYIPRISTCLMKQTYGKIRVIFVDDGSTDGTYNLEKKIALQDSRFTVIRTKHVGVSNARNTGIRESKSDYLLFLDADDCIDEYYVENLLDGYKTEMDLVVCSYQYEDEHGNIIRKNAITNDIQLNREDALVAALGMEGFEGYVWNKMFKRKIIFENQINFRQELSIYEDMQFVIDYIKCIKRDVLLLSQGVYHYIAHPDGAMLNFNIKKKENGVLASMLINEAVKENNESVKMNAANFFWKTLDDWIYCSSLEQNYVPDCQILCKIDDMVKRYDTYIRKNNQDLMKFWIIRNVGVAAALKIEQIKRRLTKMLKGKEL